MITQDELEKTKVTNWANPTRQPSEPIKTQSVQQAPSGEKRATKSRYFELTCYWSRKWHKFFKRITERKNAKPTQTQITLDIQV